MHPYLVLVASLSLAACGSGGTPATVVHDLASASTIDLASNTTLDDLSMSVSDMSIAPGADLACMPPAGNDCPSTTGNCKGIGAPCTKGGGECAAAGNACDKDMSDSGVGICIKIGACAPGMHQCGAGATCCATSDTFFIPVCLPNQCLSTGCTAE